MPNVPYTSTSTWGSPTPEGHIYREPENMLDLRNKVGTHAQSYVEGWPPAERVPAPTWEMVAMAVACVDEARGIIADLAARRAEEHLWTYDGIVCRFCSADVPDNVTDRWAATDHDPLCVLARAVEMEGRADW
jgi:hypothetical protein